MVYLDNGATAPVCKEAADACLKAFEYFGNPSSTYAMGVEAKKDIKRCAGKIEEIINADEGTFYFTSGATEANNWALFGAAGFNCKRGSHIITSRAEHPSVLEPARLLEGRGFRVTYLSPDKKGDINMAELEEAISDDTVLVSLMSVNNETGAMSDIEAIGSLIKRANKKTAFHVDGTASFCKIPTDVNKGQIDLLSVSGHKIHAPKGVGGLYIRKGTRIAPLIVGGGQQKNMRSGTENTAYISSLAAAAEMCAGGMKSSYTRLENLKGRLLECVLSLGGEVNGEKTSPYVLNASFRGMKSQVVINALEERGIIAAAGSACSSNKKNSGGPLLAMGLDTQLLESAVRFSFSVFTTDEEISLSIEALTDVIGKYRGKI